MRSFFIACLAYLALASIVALEGLIIFCIYKIEVAGYFFVSRPMAMADVILNFIFLKVLLKAIRNFK